MRKECEQACAEGNPIQTALGNKLQIETDYVAGGAFPITFSRIYNSVSQASSSSSNHQWRHTFERRLLPRTSQSPPSVDAFRDGGRTFRFTLIAGSWVPDGDVADRLSRLFDGSGIPTGWQYTVASDDSVERYDGSGTLLAITYRNGLVLQFTYAASLVALYPGSAPACTGITRSPGKLSCITDSLGRQLNLAYDGNGRLSKLVDFAGGETVYGYDVKWDIVSVTYPDGKVKSYKYNESAHTASANLPYALTGIVDENNVRFATYKYDAQGRAISTEHAGGVQKISVAYGSDTATFTDALTTARTYTFQTILGAARPTGLNLPCSGCSQPFAAVSYDANANPSSKTDFNGNTSCYAYDASRNLQTVRVEGFASGVVCPSSLSSYSPTSGTRQRKITTQWHSTYHLPTQIDEPGKRTTFTHDANGNVLTRTELDTGTGASRTWTYTYNGFGQVLTLDGPRTDVLDVTTYTYYTCTTGYQCGQVHTITNAAGHVTTYNTYNAHGQPLTMTDPNGVVTTLAYDLRQRLTSRTVDAEVTAFEYWPTGLLKKATLPDGSYLEYTYDAAHRLTDLNDAEGNRIHYTLDLMGNRTGEQAYDPSNALTRTRTRVFNSLNRLYQEIGAAGTANVTTTFGYDNNGNQTSIAAPLGRDTAQTYDELNRLKDVTDPLNGVTQYGYNALDQLISVTDPRGLVTSYSYNALGDLGRQTSPDTGVTTNTYDSGGNLATSTDARDAVATYTYDALNRVATTSFSSGSTTDQTLTYTYDAGTYGNGHLTGVSDANHSLSWTYDQQGRVLTATQVVGAISKTTSYTYANGLRQSMTTPSGQVISYGYTNGKVTSVSVNGTVVVSNILYDPFGPVSQWTWADGSLSVRTFDQDGNVAQVDSAGLKTYSYDDAFRITGITDTTNSALSWSYGYDDLDRLANASKTGTTLGYSYDANGNRLTETGSNPSTFTVATNSNRLSSTSGALSRTYGYDAAGNTTSFTGVSFTYNNRGRMSSSTRSGVATTYTYNALGQLIRKGSSALYYYDDAGHIVGIYNNSGSLTEEMVWLGDTPIATLRPQAGGGLSIYSIHTDHLNTPRVVTDSVSAAVRWRWDGDPFGGGAVNDNPSGAGAFEFNLRFPGQIVMAETGLHYNYFRDYDAATGRYVQSDPLGLYAGVNTYEYVHANPMHLSDPLGLDPFWCTVALDNAYRAAGLGSCRERKDPPKPEITCEEKCDALLAKCNRLVDFFPVGTALAGGIAGRLLGPAGGAAGGSIGGISGMSQGGLYSGCGVGHMKCKAQCNSCGQ